MKMGMGVEKILSFNAYPPLYLFANSSTGGEPLASNQPNVFNNQDTLLFNDKFISVIQTIYK